MGHLNELHEEFDEQGLLVLGVAIESNETKGDVVAYSKKNIRYPVVWDAQNRTALAYNVSGIPAAFLLDRDNAVVWQGHPLELTAGKVKDLLKRAQ